MSKMWMMHWMAPVFVSRQLRRCCCCFITSTHIIPILANTLSPTGEENYGIHVEVDVRVGYDDEADDLEEGTVEQDENEPHFDSIL